MKNNCHGRFLAPSAALTVSLKRYPDTNPFARSFESTLQAETSQGGDADAARARALAAYKDFLTLWQDADPDIPILITAKSEYAQLQ